MEQYLTSEDYSAPFDLKVVPVSQKPLTVTEKGKSAVSPEVTSVKKEEKKTRLEVYAGLFVILEF